MKHLLGGILALIPFALAAQQYLPTRVTDSSSTYFGRRYADPYRWLEDAKNPEVETWFRSQDQLTDSILSRIPGRKELVSEWMSLDKLQTEKISSIRYAGGKYFYNKRIAGDKVAKFYCRIGLNGAETLLFDPTEFIKGKTLAIRSAIPSHDGSKVALAYTEGGAEICSIRVIDVRSSKMLPEVLYPSWDGAFSWTPDDKAFTYSWLQSGDVNSPDISLDCKTKLHVAGRPVTEDLDFFSREKYPALGLTRDVFPEASFVDDNKKYVFGKVGGVDAYRGYSYYFSRTNTTGKYSAAQDWKLLCSKDDKLVGTLEVMGDSVFAISVKGAGNGQLLVTGLANPDWNKAEIIVPEKKDLKLETITHSRSYVYLTYSDGVNMHLFKYHIRNRKLTPVTTPFVGSFRILCLDKTTDECLLYVTSWTRPLTEFSYVASTDSFRAGPFNKSLRYPAAYEELKTEELSVTGHDGVLIPLTLIYNKNMKKDGSNICLMDGYGAYGKSTTSGLEIRENALAVKNVIIAIAHIRGGGEKGEEWYYGGFKTTKPNTWKDFISCAEYLIDNGYTSKGKMAGTGTSAGGITISRAITERPDLFAAAICNVGVANAMRFEFSPNGPSNVAEFGTVNDSIGATSLYEMDGVMHVRKDVPYPAVLCVGGWNDPRVPAWQPGKFAAALQNASTSGKPVLMKTNFDNGHFTEDRSVTFANFADQYAFVLWQCGHPDFQVTSGSR